MGIFSTNTVTVFNSHTDSFTEKETWIVHVFKNVKLITTQGANITTSGLTSADSAKLYIDVDQLGNYLGPVEWDAQTLEDKLKSITFTPQKTFFVKGDLSDVEPMPSGFLEYIRNHYDDVYVVTTVDKFMDVMPHFEIGGK